MKSFGRSHNSSASSSNPHSSPSTSSASSSWVHLRSLLIVAPSPRVHDRGSLKSPWSRRKRKRALSLQQWNHLFSPDGQLRDEVKFLKKVRSGGIDPGIRAEVWPFLLGVYDLSSTEAERNTIKRQNRKEYKKLRRQCRQILTLGVDGYKELKVADGKKEVSPCFNEGPESSNSEDVFSARQSLSIEESSPDDAEVEQHVSESTIEGGGPQSISSGQLLSQSVFTKGENPDDGSEEPGHDMIFHSTSCLKEDGSGVTHVDSSTTNSESSDSESSIEEPESMQMSSVMERTDGSDIFTKVDSLEGGSSKSLKSHRTAEDYATWQRIIRLDALRANAEWIPYSSSQATVSEDKARHCAEMVCLKDYDHLEPCRIYHAARLVAVLEVYAIYDPEIGYCQGMSDLLSPIVAVMEDDTEAFWCFVGFMKKARHNFRLDEVGIRRQLNLVSKIIKYKDSQLYRHLEKLQAEDCFFVYRMVVVLFRRELSFEQTLCLWEVMWADQAAIRAGIGKSAWKRIRQRAPPTEDLLLYAIAACVLQRRKQIIEKYSSMDEILKECNSMAGQLDVWRLLDDAHDLVVAFHDKI
uniref:GTPase-activating protein GYP7 n=1 Tax=Anthurium amnicola TaxID=1678845 RepID=A0A1D1YE98_9ARAE